MCAWSTSGITLWLRGRNIALQRGDGEQGRLQIVCRRPTALGAGYSHQLTKHDTYHGVNSHAHHVRANDGRTVQRLLSDPWRVTHSDGGQIKKAYRKLARKHHPDVNPEDQTAKDKLKELNEAYKVAIRAEKRERYDELGSGWKAGADFTPPPGWQTGRMKPGDFGDLFGGGQGQGGFSDFFEALFGESRGPRAGPGFAMRGADIEADTRSDPR